MTLTKRDWLIEEVMCGRLTPNEAEAQALTAGIEPLATCPDPALFDPMQESFWTFTMAVAWIAWRTENAVREAWRKYRDEVWFFATVEWRRCPTDEIHSGWQLKQHGPSISHLAIREALNNTDDGDDPLLLSVPDAVAALWRGLLEGALTASAVHDKFSQRTEIPAIEWQDLKLTDANGQEALTGISGAVAVHVHYLKPTIASAQILAKWPQDGVLPEMAVRHEPIKTPSTATKAQLEAAYVKRRDEWPSDKPTPSERDDRAFLKKIKPDITRDRARELRRKLAPDNWKERGKRKPRS